MASKILLQGVTTDSHLSAVRELLGIPNATRVIVSAAYMNRAGFLQLSTALTPLAHVTTVLAGIRNGITSAQGMRAAVDSGCLTYAVDTGSRSLVFHPKVYLAKSAVAARLIVGSANLTIGGMTRNIESSVSMELDLADPDDAAFVADIETKIDGMIAEYGDNVFVVPDVAAVAVLLASGRVVDETVVTAPKPSGTSSHPELDTVPKMTLKTQPLLATLGAAPAAPAPPAPAAPTPAVLAPVAPAVPIAPAVPVGPKPPAVRGLMWQSKPLARRDLNIPDGDNTNKTGSINLDKGLLPDATDHRHYFRDEVFDALVWHARSATVDEARALFQLVLKGVSYGEFDLAIRHSTSTTSKTYIQRNAVFRLSWGPAVSYVAHVSLIGRTLSLYRDMSDPAKFDLEID